MAQKIEVTLIDDIDGSLAEGTVTFSLFGQAYELELSKQNREELEAAIRPYTLSARKLTATPRKPAKRSHHRPAPSTNTTIQATDGPLSTLTIREWAKRKGYIVGRYGRLPQRVLDGFREALLNEQHPRLHDILP